MVYVNGPRVLPAVLGAGCPVVFHAHNYVRVRYGRKILEWTLRASDATVIAASQYVADSYTRVPGSAKVRVIYNGIGDLQGAARTFDNRRVRIGIIGRIAREKGHLDFMRAARRITEHGLDAGVFVYGERLFSDSKLRSPGPRHGRRRAGDLLRLDE